MRDFDDSTLWRISAYERMRAETGSSGFARLGARTVLPTTLNAELAQVRHGQREADLLEVVAASMRQRESVLVLLQHAGLVWPLTLFPQQALYHVPRPILPSLAQGTRGLEVLAIEPPGLRPPGHFMHERVAEGPGYRPLAPLLWTLAQNAPRTALFEAIAGRAAYRLAADFNLGVELQLGALGPALQRLRTEIASLADIAGWPGMDTERAVRLLNGVYLLGGLRVMRVHPAAREAPVAGRRRLLDWWRGGR